MTTETLEQKLDTLDPDQFDFTDPNAYAKAMGYETDGNDATDTTASQQGDTAGAGAATGVDAPVATAAAAESSATPAAAANEPADVVGVLTKDGKHVIPYDRLQSARTEAATQRMRAQQLEETNAQLTAQIEALKSGKPLDTGDQIDDDKLARIKADFPDLAPFVEAVKTMQDQRAAAPAKADDPNAVVQRELTAAEELDRALAPRPLLTKYAQAGGVVWGRAVEIDKELDADPRFANLTTAARFEEVEKRLADELGIAIPTVNTPNNAAGDRTNAVVKALQNAERPDPSTLTDIGGTAPRVDADVWQDRPPVDALAAAEKLSDEGLMRLAGLSY